MISLQMTSETNDPIEAYHHQNHLVEVFNTTRVDLATAKKIVQVRKSLTPRQTAMVLDFRHVKEITKEARDFLTHSPEATHGLLGIALVIDSFLGRLIANLMMHFNRPDYPFRAFNTLDEANRWANELSQHP